MFNYIKKERSYSYRGFKLQVFPGVFHPGLFFSTKFLFSFLEPLALENKKCLEIGCGSGLLSLLMLRKKAIVTAIDIQDLALKNTAINFEKNRVSDQFTLIKSDLLSNVPPQTFDYIIINPPYFFDEVKDENGLPWFCGKNGEYFVRLFRQLRPFIAEQGSVFMVLAENCDVPRIRKLAEDENFRMELILEKKIWWETNYIFKIIPLI